MIERRRLTDEVVIVTRDEIERLRKIADSIDYIDRSLGCGYNDLDLIGAIKAMARSLRK